jgi:hypothetical protein
MAATPEGKVKKAIKKALDEAECWQYWPVPTGLGRRTVDVLGLHMGDFFAVEAKAPGKPPTRLQEAEMARISASGGVVFVIDNVADVSTLREWLNRK